MEKIDLRKKYRELYSPPSNRVVLVEVPDLLFIMLDGKIEPGATPGTSPSFKQAMEALYGISYTLKFMAKLRKDSPVDYTVMGLEALWWIEEGFFDITKPDNWCWRAMIMQPELISRSMFDQALSEMKRKKDNSALDQLRLEQFREGLCIQIMHIGPYATEPDTVRKMEDFVSQNGYCMQHEHHEIYIGNPLRADPAKLKTILRHPIARV